MRTKLLAAAAIIAAGIATSMAQSNVYSLNVVGYVNKSIPANYSLIANPLNGTNNSLSTILAGAPNFTAVLRWNGTGFDSSTLTFGTWSPDFTLNPGEGFFINPGPTGFTNTFVGEVMQGSLSNSIPAGYSLRGSQVPQDADVTVLDLTDNLNNFDAILKWNGTGYDSYTLTFGSWTPSTPTLGVADAFFVNAGAPTAWIRNFTVAP
jgi:hypothetical protein